MALVQIREIQKAKHAALVKGAVIAGCGVAASILLPFAFLGVIGAVGFGAGGVAAGKETTHI